MKRIGAAERGELLAIHHPVGGTRPIAELFVHADSIVVVDIGWPGATWHPVHALTGSIIGAGPWHVGHCSIWMPTEGERVLEELRAWRTWRMTTEGKRYDREYILALLQADGLLP